MSEPPQHVEPSPLTETPSMTPAASARERYLRDYLATEDAPCPRCAYNLHGLRGERCPECGLEIQLGVIASASFTSVYVWALSAGVATAGGGFFFGLVALTQAPRDWWASLSGMLLIAVTLAGAGEVVWLLRKRRPFLRRSPHGQRWIAGVFWAINIVLMVLTVVFFDD